MSITRDRLQNLLTGWALFTAILPTLIVYRAALQPRYQWGLFGVAGEGVTAGYFIVVAAAALAWCAVVLGNLWPVAGGPAFIVLYAVWFAAITIGAVQLGSKMTVRGDAWGIGINVAVLGPILFGALLVLSLRWFWTGRARAAAETRCVLSGTHRVLLGLALALVPFIVVLFAQGNGLPHRWTDRLAVVCVVVQALLAGAGLRDVVVPAERDTA